MLFVKLHQTAQCMPLQPALKNGQGNRKKEERKAKPYKKERYQVSLQYLFHSHLVRQLLIRFSVRSSTKLRPCAHDCGRKERPCTNML